MTKPKKRTAFKLWTAGASTLLLSICARPAAAASLTWDASGISPLAPTDGGGTWDLTSHYWSNASQDQSWSAADIAAFGDASGAAGTVNLAVPITAAGLVFNPPGSASYNLSGASLNLSAGTIQLNNADATISSSIIAPSLALSGTGTLTLSGSNSNPQSFCSVAPSASKNPIDSREIASPLNQPQIHSNKTVPVPVNFFREN
jgi:hypothetical protein